MSQKENNSVSTLQEIKQQAVTGLYKTVWHDLVSKLFQRTIPGTANLNHMSAHIKTQGMNI